MGRKKGSGTGQAYPSPVGMEDWRGEDDHRTLTRAAEIKGDKGRMAGVMKHQAKQVKALKTVGSDISTSKVRQTKEYKGVMSQLKRGC